MSPGDPTLDADLADTHELTADLDVMVDDFDVSFDSVDELDADFQAADEVEVVAGAEQGLPGPPGPTGAQGGRGAPGRDGAPGGALSRRSAGPLAGGRTVVAVDADQVRALDGTDPDDAERIVGVAVASAAAAGEELEVVRLGLVRDPGWSFTPPRPVFAGLSGELVHEPPPGMTFWVRIGVAHAADAVFVDPQPPIYLV